MAKTEMFECPHCGSFNCTIDDYEIDVDDVFLEQTCLDCGASWREYGTITFAGFYYDGKNYDQDGREADV